MSNSQVLISDLVCILLKEKALTEKENSFSELFLSLFLDFACLSNKKKLFLSKFA